MKIQKYLSFIVLLSYCGLIYWLSDQPSLPTPMLFPHQDKVFHAGAYFIMAVFAWNVCRYWLKDNKRRLITVVFFCSLYGISDETHQFFVEGRQADVLDWLADTLGAVLAMLVLQQSARCLNKLKLSGKAHKN